MNISIHFLWQEGNCRNDLRADWCHQEHSLLQTMRLEKRDKRFIFSRSSAARFWWENKRGVLPFPSFYLFSIIFCIVFFILKTIAKLFGNGAKRLTKPWCLSTREQPSGPTASHAGCDFFFDRLPNRDRDSQRQAKAPFHTQLDRAKKPSFVLDFPSKKCNHVLPPLAFKGYFPIHCHKIHFTRTQVRQIAVRARLLALPKNMWRQASFVTSFVSFFLPLCIFSWFF